jgi:hypothetical protein
LELKPVAASPDKPVTGRRGFEPGHFAGEFTFPRAGVYTLFVTFLPPSTTMVPAGVNAHQHRRRLTATEGTAHAGMAAHGGAGHSMDPGTDHSMHMGHPDSPRSPLEHPSPFLRSVRLQVNVTEHLVARAPHHARHAGGYHVREGAFHSTTSPLVPWPAMYQGTLVAKT